VVAQPPAPKSIELFRVFVSVDPADAQLFVDGQSRSGAPPFMIEAKNGAQVHLEARRDGFQPALQTVTIADADQRVSLNLTATPPAASGKLKVFVEPWAMVEVDGKNIGQTPKSITLAAGAHSVRLINEKAGHPSDRPYERRVTIRAGKTESIDLDWTHAP
jgi:hypothetical protein